MGQGLGKVNQRSRNQGSEVYAGGTGGLVKQIRQGGKGRTEGERPGEISTNGKGRGSWWYKIGKLMVYSNEQLSTQLEYNVLFFYSALCQ